MRVVFLGTGSSLGTPMIGCTCAVCRSDDPHDKRLRASLYVESRGERILIDPGPDFRAQCLHHGITQIDTFLITHPHRDHIGGLDDTRAVYYAMDKRPLQFYAEDFTLEGIFKYYDYLFPREGNSHYHGAPQARFQHIEAFRSFATMKNEVIPLRGWHGSMPVTGFRIGRLVYLTDVKEVPAETVAFITPDDVLVLGALQQQAHAIHFNLDEALAFVEQTRPAQTFLTHIGHRMGKHSDLEAQLPVNVRPAYDGLVIEI